jgi:hypothetical protein
MISINNLTHMRKINENGAQKFLNMTINIEIVTY